MDTEGDEGKSESIVKVFMNLRRLRLIYNNCDKFDNFNVFCGDFDENIEISEAKVG